MPAHLSEDYFLSRDLCAFRSDPNSLGHRILYGGTKTRLYTSSRRMLAAWEALHPPWEQWDSDAMGFGNRDTNVRNRPLEFQSGSASTSRTEPVPSHVALAILLEDFFDAHSSHQFVDRRGSRFSVPLHDRLFSSLLQRIGVDPIAWMSRRFDWQRFLTKLEELRSRWSKVLDSGTTRVFPW